MIKVKELGIGRRAADEGKKLFKVELHGVIKQKITTDVEKTIKEFERGEAK